MNTALMSSAKQDWRTPENVLELVRQVGPIGLDPCTTPDNPTKAAVFYTPADDGLAGAWLHWQLGLGLTYVNPPYSDGLPVWTAKMAVQGRFGAEIIGLVPARTDTRWWHDSILKANAICFWKGRIRFVGATASAPFPSALPYWGCRVDRFAEVFAPYGWVVRL